MASKVCLMALALALMALECSTAAVNTSTIVDHHRTGRATVSDSCKCGKKLSGNRIVGGTLTNVNEYPWQAALADESGHQFCGGSLITDLHVVTAAHCVTGMKPGDLEVRLREHHLHQLSGTVLVTKGVNQIISHKKYNFKNDLNDIAILTLDSVVNVSPSLLPVCLPSNAKATYGGVTATVTGWGATSSGGTSSDVLREVDVPVLPPAVCKKQTNYAPSDIKNRMLCAGAEGIDSCQGDSGGPLVVRNTLGNYQLIGIVSWGIGCAEKGYPGVYTRVNKYLKWIEKMTKRGTYCTGAASTLRG